MRFATTLMATLACTGAVKIKSDPFGYGDLEFDEHGFIVAQPTPEGEDFGDFALGEDFGEIIDWFVGDITDPMDPWMIECWHPEMTEPWEQEMIENWDPEMIEPWEPEMIENWDPEMIEHWEPDMFEHWGSEVMLE